MKLFIIKKHFIIFSLLIFFGLNYRAQTFSHCLGDSIKLNIGTFTGNLQWQESSDSLNWVSIPGATTSPFGFIFSGSAYYRAAVTSPNCNPVYSPVQHVVVASVNTVSNASANPTVCSVSTLPNITHTTSGATGIGNPIGLPAGVTATWANNIITISGTPSASGTFNYSIPLTGGCGSVSATGTITVALANCYPANSVFCNGPTQIIEVTNPSTGKTWMDRNLGASQVASSSTDTSSYGNLYQWGRRSDGHQCRNSPTITTLSSTDIPPHSSFIINNNSPYDWRSPQNTNLWQGVNGANNPCPVGFRLPTNTELDAERLSWSANNSSGALASPLKWPLAGYRVSFSGVPTFVGTNSYIWSSTVSTIYTVYFNFNSSSASFTPGNRAHGFTVRCIKN